MRIFTFYIHDDRYSVPDLLFVDANDDDSARDLAFGRLNQSTHYLAIDVHEGETPLFVVERTPTPEGHPLRVVRAGLNPQAESRQAAAD